MRQSEGDRINQLLNYMAHNWGMECADTIEGFHMAENGANWKTLKDYIVLTEAVWANDWFGFIG